MNVSTPNLKALLDKNVLASSTKAFQCPVIQYEPIQKPLIPFQSEIFAPYFSRTSNNSKKSLSKERKKEIEDVIYRYKQLTQSLSPIREDSPLKRSPRGFNAANAMIQKVLKSSNPLAVGINTLTKEKKEWLEDLKKASAPKVKRPKTALTKEQKRTQAKKDREQVIENQQEEIGTYIQQYRMITAQLERDDYKYFKPWQQKPKNMPKWAEDLQDKPLAAVIKYDKEGVEAVKQLFRNKRTLELDTSLLFSKDQGWKSKDFLYRKKDEGDGIDHAKRLAQIYGKFLDTFQAYQEKQGGTMDPNQKFDPKAMQSQTDSPIKKDSPRKLVQFKDQDGSFESDGKNIDLDMVYESQNVVVDLQVQKTVSPNPSSPVFDEIEYEDASDFDDDLFITQSDVGAGTQSMPSTTEGSTITIQIHEEIAEKISGQMKRMLAEKEVYLEREDQEGRYFDKIKQKQLEEERVLAEIQLKKEQEEERLAGLSAFAREFERMAKKQFELAKPIIARELLYEDIKEQQNLELQQQIQKEREEAASRPVRRNYAAEKQHERLNKVNKLLGKGKPSNADSQNTLIQRKLDNWLNNFDKKIESQAAIDKMLVDDYNENRDEVKLTLEQFEDALKYYNNHDLYKKELAEMLKKLDRYETETQKIIIQSSIEQAEAELDYNFVGQKPQKPKQEPPQNINVDLSGIINRQSIALTSGRISIPIVKSDSEPDDIDWIESPLILTPTRLDKLSIPLTILQQNESLGDIKD